MTTETVTVALQVGGRSRRLVLPAVSQDPIVELYRNGEQANDYLIDLLERLFPEPTVVVDLGCHVGTFAVAAAALGHRVIAVDASPLHVELVRRSAQENGFAERVTVLHAAVSDAHGTVRFHEDGLFGAVSAAGDVGVEIPARTVPELLATAGCELSDVALLKADVEGSELRALQGLTSLLIAPDAPAIVYESNPMTSEPFGFSVDGIRTALELVGYRTYRLGPAQLYTCPPLEPQPEAWIDLLALKPPHVERLGLPVEPLPHDALVALFEHWAALPHANVRAYVAQTLIAGWSRAGQDARLVAVLERLAADEDPDVRRATAWPLTVAPQALGMREAAETLARGLRERLARLRKA
jgi:FkbM family methyltransferase